MGVEYEKGMEWVEVIFISMIMFTITN